MTRCMRHVPQCSSQLKLPVLHLVDSLIKNVGEPFKSLFSARLHEVRSTRVALDSLVPLACLRPPVPSRRQPRSEPRSLIPLCAGAKIGASML